MDFDALGKHQWGHLTWSDLLTFMTEWQARSDIADGRFIRALHGVYRIAGVPELWRHGPMAAYLAVGAGAIGSRCAGKLLGMPHIPGRPVQLIVPPTLRPRLPGVQVIHSNLLPLHHIEYLDALPVTTAARVICDLSAGLSRNTVAKVLRGAVRLDLTSYEEVWKVRDELRARGRRRTTVIDQVLDGRIPGATPGDSEGEHQLVEWIDRAGLRLPKQQHWVMTAGGRYCLDLAYVEEKIDIEWDSDLHEKTPDDVEYDAARDIELELCGWFVMRNSRLTTREDFIRRLSDALEQRGPRTS
jgi:very-short-patch-repair endonuclease